MINKKFLWILIPLSILLVCFTTIQFASSKTAEIFNAFHLDASVRNTKYIAVKLKNIQFHLDKGELEEARKFIDQLYAIEIKQLELMLDSNGYPEQISRQAKKALAEIEAGNNKSTSRDERNGENSNQHIINVRTASNLHCSA